VAKSTERINSGRRNLREKKLRGIGRRMNGTIAVQLKKIIRRGWGIQKSMKMKRIRRNTNQEH